MRLLILGGTRFLGRHLAEQALAAGNHVTLLHRGRSGPDLFPQAEHRVADRDGPGLADALAGGTWDVVIDTSAYVPRQVRAAAAALAGRAGRYHLVSSISAYESFEPAPMTEHGALKALDDPAVETVTGATYGGLKALCEQAAMQAWPQRCLVSRPGLIVGPHDPTGRYTWWVQRLARAGAGDEVLAPGDPGAAIQCIDARDAAAWHLLQADQGTTGTCNLTGPAEPTTMGAFLESARSQLAPAARLSWVSEAFLLEQGVAPWTELPLWLPRADAAMHRVDIRRALASGLRCRPMAETIADTAAWARAAPPPAEGGPLRPPVGMAPAREAALLASWRRAPRP